jgi:transposase InsO family protein
MLWADACVALLSACSDESGESAAPQCEPSPALLERVSAGEHMTQDVTAYMRHYNQERFHSSNGDMSPVKFEDLE